MLNPALSISVSVAQFNVTPISCLCVNDARVMAVGVQQFSSGQQVFRFKLQPGKGADIMLSPNHPPPHCKLPSYISRMHKPVAAASVKVGILKIGSRDINGNLLAVCHTIEILCSSIVIFYYHPYINASRCTI